MGGPAELLTADTGAQSLRVLDEEELDYTSRELEAKMAAQRIRELVDGRRGLSVWDKSGGPEGAGAYRRARYGDIVILLRSMAGWSEVFVNVLMNEGIPAYAQTTSGYFDTVEAETMLSLLSVVDNPMQDIPLAAVLRSPIVGMTDEEMAWMMAAYKRRAKKGQDRGVYAAWKLWGGGGSRGKLPGRGRPWGRRRQGGGRPWGQRGPERRWPCSAISCREKGEFQQKQPQGYRRSSGALAPCSASCGRHPAIFPSRSFCSWPTGRAATMITCPPCPGD